MRKRNVTDVIKSKLVVVSFLAAIAVLIASCELQSTEPISLKAEDLTYLDQGWTEDDRQFYYHAAQGARVLPYEWFLALEMENSEKLFRSDESIARFRAIPDKNRLHNPDLLPVGFTKTVLDPSFKDPLSNEWIGLSCSACHTAEVTYKGEKIRIDGGPAMIDTLKFPKLMVKALQKTFVSIPKWNRFKKAVLKSDNPSLKESADLKLKVGAFLSKAAEVAVQNKLHDIYPLDWGFGRLDALGRGSNNVLKALSPKNVLPADAPVSFPAVWDAYKLNWVQWNGAIQQPLGRNVGEAIGVNAILETKPGPDQFKNSLNFESLIEIEEVIQKLSPPAWPEHIFGKLDQEKVKRGAKLYEELCVRCHRKGMTQPNDFGAVFKKVRMLDLEDIGTDPTAAVNFVERVVDTGELGLGKTSGAAATQYLTSGLIKRYLSGKNLTKKELGRILGERENNWRGVKKYMARPHSGVWALAPYLHNGSVPTLFEMLSPIEERRKVFYVGDLEFDPVKVGFVSKESANTFKFDTSLKGNYNTGHQFRDGEKGNGVIGRALTVEERFEIIEYLKTL